MFIVAVLPTSIITALLLMNVSTAYRDRAEIQIDQIRKYMDSAITDKASKLQEIMVSLNNYIARSEVKLLNELQQSSITPSVVGLAYEIKNASGLDYVEILNEEGIILSSGHWPANYGHSHKFKITWNDDKPVFYREQIANDYFLSVQIKKTIPLGEKVVYLIGGYKLDQKTLMPDYTSQEASAKFNLFPQQGSVSSAQYCREFKDNEGMLIATAEIDIPKDFVNSIIRSAYKQFTVVALGLIVISICVGFIIAHRITKPLDMLISTASEIGKGNLNQNIQYKGKGEISRLISAFNFMIISLREAQQKLIYTERISAWREAARRIAHEIKNPISPIQVCIKTLIKVKKEKPQVFDELFDQSTQTILEEVSKLHSLADSFSLFAQVPAPSKSATDINQLLRHITQLYGSSVGRDVMKEEYDSSIPHINVDPKLISSAFQNVIKNAVEALPKENPAIAIKTFLHCENHIRWARVIITDNGKGISKEDLDRIFQPYFTNKPKGSGLGLTIAKEIIDQHGGRIQVESEKHKGTSFTIDLPAEA